MQSGLCESTKANAPGIVVAGGRDQDWRATRIGGIGMVAVLDMRSQLLPRRLACLLALGCMSASVAAQVAAFDAAAADASAGGAARALAAFLRIAPGEERTARLALAVEVAFAAGDHGRCAQFHREASDAATSTDGAEVAFLRSRIALGRGHEFAGAAQRAADSRPAALLRALAADEAKVVALADAIMREGDLGNGLWIFRAVAERLPEDCARWSNLALALRHAGRLEESKQAYDRALLVAPDDAWTWNDYGLLLRVRGEREAALAAFRRSLACDARPGEGPGITNLVVDAVCSDVGAEVREQTLAAAASALRLRPDAALLRRAAIDLAVATAAASAPQQDPDKRRTVR